MTMDRFSEAYAEAQGAIGSGDLSGAFKSLKWGIKGLLAAGGPSASNKEVLDKLRAIISKEAGVLLVAATATSTTAAAKAIIGGAGVGDKRNDRVAMLKMLRHLYHQISAGGQQIWVYSPPVSFSKWIFDEVKGVNDTALEAAISKDADEVYSEIQRATMANAIQKARAFCQSVAVKMGKSNAETDAVVRRYFGGAATDAKALAEIRKTLASGYLKIAAACNGCSIVISDEPGDRTGGGWDDWAFIWPSESMNVIYLQGAWLTKADEISPSNQSPIYRCARTIIHELSHKHVNTEDICYGPAGLMPSSSLTPEYALHNADSWAYFGIDVLGFLTGPDKTNGEIANVAIRKTPSKTLSA
ncbi:M35 family metallo-endopeptidase [Nevskia sp.]|uniref:M35 family metallo-endopeptidase n=1 Tax=Nevskia sp. TaxID=1929292 RepID=UPI0025F9F0E6|nr:M35 family metallo-endopeptidase [Nevskia sp.]